MQRPCRVQRAGWRPLCARQQRYTLTCNVVRATQRTSLDPSRVPEFGARGSSPAPALRGTRLTTQIRPRSGAEHDMASPPLSRLQPALWGQRGSSGPCGGGRNRCASVHAGSAPVIQRRAGLKPRAQATKPPQGGWNDDDAIRPFPQHPRVRSPGQGSRLQPGLWGQRGSLGPREGGIRVASPYSRARATVSPVRRGQPNDACHNGLWAATRPRAVGLPTRNQCGRDQPAWAGVVG